MILEPCFALEAIWEAIDLQPFQLKFGAVSRDRSMTYQSYLNRSRPVPVAWNLA